MAPVELPAVASGGLTVWRICKSGFAEFDGEGARLYGGRWNHPGTRVVYASESLSLAALEYFVHLDTDLLPDGLVSVPAEVPVESGVEMLEAADLPDGWRTYPAPEALQDLGTAWIERGESPVLSLPSAVIPEQRNYLLNPDHSMFAKVLVGRTRPFQFDPRMWK